MKRLIAISAILVFLLGISIGGIFYVKHVDKKINEKLNEITIELETPTKKNPDIGKIKTLTNELCEEWEVYNNIIGTFTIHDTIDIIEGSLISLKSYADEEHINSIAPTIDEVRFHLHHLYEQELPKLKNIL